ncbi:MAG TPA: hypothetical protein VFF06_20525 [Polyangia bacterium]|nr:hypothetical protein [Polyangia bacterium]
MKHVSVKQLSLDLRNYRTVPQDDESAAIEATIAGNPEWFWALTESLLDDGYHPTENILVLKSKEGKRERLTVKEGNRRIAALKLIHGYAKHTGLGMPHELAKQINAISKEWKKANQTVPCAIYGPSEKQTVDTIVTLTHGKGERAGRDKWKAVARARHNRDANNASEPALDLLEAYLANGRNVTSDQRAKWAGDYPLSVLEDAMKRLAPRLSVSSSRVLATAYPDKSSHRSELEKLIYDIGAEVLKFEQLRDKDRDFAASYGFPAPAATATASAGGAPTTAATHGSASSGGSSNSATSPTTTPSAATAPASARTVAVPIDDPRAVARTLRSFQPKGNGREKIASLLVEARRLNVQKTPMAFCFVVRSMFELSAKAYCNDHASSGLSATKGNGEDKTLADVLREITNHLTANNTDKAKKKLLHGAMTEMGKQDGLLSVTSLNQLVHNPKFSVVASDICTLFGRIFPLLEEMNR